MGACAQIAVFTYAVMRRTPRYEIRLAAFFADNLMNSVAHCGELPINVERPLRHIYFIDSCQVCLLDAQYKVKNKNKFLYFNLHIFYTTMVPHLL